MPNLSKPNALRVVQGTRAKLRDEPQPPGAEAEDGGAGEPPSSLTAAQKKIWRESTATAARNLLSASDRDMLSAWCSAVDSFRQVNKTRIDLAAVKAAEKEVAFLARQPHEIGETAVRLAAAQARLRAAQHDADQAEHRRLVRLRDYATLVKQLAGELGFSPVGRARLATKRKTNTATGVGKYTSPAKAS